MMSINEYVKLLLKKKKWSNVRFVEEINKVEERLGEQRMRPQNLTNMLNEDRNLSYKTLIKFEYVLGLPFGTLMNLTPNQPKSKEAKKELNRIIEKVRGK